MIPAETARCGRRGGESCWPIHRATGPALGGAFRPCLGAAEDEALARARDGPSGGGVGRRARAPPPVGVPTIDLGRPCGARTLVPTVHGARQWRSRKAPRGGLATPRGPLGVTRQW